MNKTQGCFTDSLRFGELHMNHSQYQILIYIMSHLNELPKVRTFSHKMWSGLTFIVAYYYILFSILFWGKKRLQCICIPFWTHPKIFYNPLCKAQDLCKVHLHKDPKFSLPPISRIISKADGTINTSESHGGRCGSEASESSILFQPKSVWHRVSLGSLRAASILPWGAGSPSSPDNVSNLSVTSWSPVGKSMVWWFSRLSLVQSGEFVSSI